MFVSSPLTHSWTGDLVVRCHVLLLATRPGGFTEVKRQKSNVGQKAVASNGSRIEGEHGRGGAGGRRSDSLVNIVSTLPKFFLLLRARMCWLAIMGKAQP